jgi:superfamily II DNA or RNA helicase
VAVREKVLRDFQRASVAAVLGEFDKGKTSTLLVLPTGCGKTIVMAKIAAAWERGNVLLLAHRIELLDQAADKMEPELGYRPVVEQGERGMDADCLWHGGAVLVGSVQTMRGEARMEKFRRAPFDLVLIDEAHHATAASYRKVVDYFRGLNPHVRVLGVTATPNRADDTALGIVFDSVAYEMGIAQAIDLGWLVPVEQEYVAVEEVDFSAVGTAKNDLGESDLKAADLESVLVEEEALHALARPILDKAGSRQCLVFTAGVAHAHLLAAVLNRYRDGSAKAVDGKTLDAERKAAVAAFARGELQFLTNFGVFTEGFDVPSVALVAMGRPTKSVGLYTQMLGRGTRPLPGVVDGPPAPESRRAAIAASGKPKVLVLDFVGNSRHKLVSSVDVLGGNYDAEVRELARKQVADRKGADVMKELKKARAELLLMKEQERRRGVVARVGYSTQAVDPFGHDAAPGASSVEQTRGGASDAQIAFLVGLGVQRDTAARFNRRQASAVIEDLKAKRCTSKQRAVLARYGEDPDVNFEEASATIDAIARNGWRPLHKEAV